ncbi:MAG: hypothetical protein HW387_407 [Parachlamydiales bacterium]|nr:hypothetical protein [Parachlamydiales bacterium]
MALICASLALPLMAQKESGAPTDQIRIVAVDPIPEPETVVTLIQLPHEGDVVSGNPVWIQLRVDGYALGTNSPFNRAGEIANSDMGQTVHVVIDDNPYFAINGPSIQPFNEEGFYYNQSYKFEIPYKLKDGFHSIRVFPARSFGESLKGDRTYQAGHFHVGKASNGEQLGVLNRPYLTYNEPSDQMRLLENKPVLLDFYITNCELSPDGFKVRMTIDGKTQRTVTSWRPYYIYGLKGGKHTLRLELVDEKNKVVPGPYNDVQHTIVVH